MKSICRPVASKRRLGFHKTVDTRVRVGYNMYLQIGFECCLSNSQSATFQTLNSRDRYVEGGMVLGRVTNGVADVVGGGGEGASKFCGNCGTAFAGEDGNFCTQCGYPRS